MAEYHAVWGHPYSLHVFGMVLGFALVMRIQIAYARFWEGATQAAQMASKWVDVASQVVCFDEASSDAYSENAIDFRLKILHFTSLMHACALLEMRQDDRSDPTAMALNPEDPYLYEPASAPVLVGFSARDSGLTDSAKSRASDPNQQAARAAPAPADAEAPAVPPAHAAILAAVDGRFSTAVPLQQLINRRRSLTVEQNSFVPIVAGEKAAQPKQPKQPLRRCRSWATSSPQSRSSSPTLVSRANSTGAPGSTGGTCTGTGVAPLQTAPLSPPPLRSTASTVSRRGSLKASEYVASTVLLRGSHRTFSRLARANRFDVVGGVSDDEAALLAGLPPDARCHTVQTWMLRLMTARIKEGGLAIPPPILSRTYQVLSDGTLAAAQANKIANHPFPFPLRQLLALMLTVFVCLVPLCIAAFIDSVPLVPVLSFFVILGYSGLNEAARELEQPFGLGANNLCARPPPRPPRPPRSVARSTRP